MHKTTYTFVTEEDFDRAMTKQGLTCLALILLVCAAAGTGEAVQSLGFVWRGAAILLVHLALLGLTFWSLERRKNRIVIPYFAQRGIRYY